ncbi:restriction endonuclease [Micromonospora aurantiaca]|uniref:restriction endonuclease n=1 Tax=Micromonospora aurantiaca (nom. illeg.) TaxID=47850 RepID=UPI0037B28BD6
MSGSRAAKRISGAAYNALRAALAGVFWYRPTLEKFLRAALREHPELLAGVNFGVSKREIADEVVDRLIEGEHVYQHASVQLMIELANMQRFPELERHENADKWLPRAQAAVADLKTYTALYEGIISERERLDAEQAAYIQQVELQRRFAQDLDDLRDRFLAMHVMTDVHERGRQFEDFLNNLFALFDLSPRLAYSLASEQIDGSISFDTDDYIIEAKWTKEPVSREQADAFAKKVERKGKNALGLIVSINDLSEPARATYGEATCFMTLSGSDLFAILEGRIPLDEALRRKKRHANDTGSCHFPVNEMF